MESPSIRDLQVGALPAWAWFVSEFGAPVARYARHLGHPDPDDVAGATMETIVKYINRFDGGHSELRSFVFSIAHARIVDELRSARSKRDVSVSAVPEETDHSLDGRSEVFSSPLESVLSQLSEKQRRLIYLRYVHGASTREAAQLVGDSEGATRVALSRALNTLREALAQNDGKWIL